MPAENGNKVKVNYTVKLVDGTLVDTSEGREPLEFTIGQGQLIPGVEEAVTGMETGESKTVNVPPEKAYGPHHKEMTLKVERSALPETVDPQVGLPLQLQKEDGGAIDVIISEVTDTGVTLDANHPLAGEELVFDLELVEIG